MSIVFPEDMHAPFSNPLTITTIENFLNPSGNPTLVWSLPQTYVFGVFFWRDSLCW